MAPSLRLLAALLPLAALAGQAGGARDAGEVNPVTKVVNLLKEMKANVEKEAEDDKETYDKMACWCQTNDREKTKAIEVAEKTITDLTAAIEEYIAEKAKLGTEIEKLQEEIADNSAALETAFAMREKEAAEFSQEEKDAMDAVKALKDALAVLSKVGLNQMPSRTVLLQIKGVVTKAARVYRDVMKEDLWDLLSDLGGPGLSDSFLPTRVITGALQQPIEGGGGVAGAKSYNSRSGQIVGILSTMLEEFEKNLSNSQKEELQAQINFQMLRAAKEAEIAAANKAIEAKTKQLADTGAALAQAKQDLEDTQNALSEDQKFLIDLKKRCAIADKEYGERTKSRQDEIIAISETIKILTDDSARDLFSKTMSFLQVSSQKRGRGHLTDKHTQAERAKHRHAAAQKVLALAKKYKNWQLAGLAVSMQLDTFTKIKEIMDKMIAQLKVEQEEEVKKHESCKTDLDQNEDTTVVKTHEKEDIETTIGELDASLELLKQGLETVETEVADSHTSLKSYGEERKAENLEFQKVVADQRAVVQILNKALERLKMFYEKKALVQVGTHGHQEPVPGAAAPPPPPSGKAYEKSGGAGGVMQMIAMIIQDAEKAETEAIESEKDAQAAYAESVTNTNAFLQAAANEITEKTVSQKQAEGDKEVAEKNLMAAEEELKTLAETNKALHLSCDFLLKNFDVRQTARSEEIEAIQEAKAILSGADFSGEAAEE